SLESEVGRSLRIPNVVTNVRNNADTFSPYNPNTIIPNTPWVGAPFPHVPTVWEQTIQQLARIIHDSTSFSSPRRARAPSTSPDLIRVGVKHPTVQLLGFDLLCAGGREPPAASRWARGQARWCGITRPPGSLWAVGCGCARDARSRAHRS